MPASTITLNHFETTTVSMKRGYEFKSLLTKHGVTAEVDIERFCNDYSSYISATVETYTGKGIIIHIAEIGGKTVRKLSVDTVTPSEWDFAYDMFHSFKDKFGDEVLADILEQYKTPVVEEEAEVA